MVDIERGQFADAKPYIWQTDTAVAKNSWCYTEENDYKSSVQILQDLVDIVSKNGRMMLNVGPKADGTIPDEDKKILLEIGEWLKVNGKAIYGAKLWRKSAEGPTEVQEGQFADGEAKQYTSEDIRFTMNGGCLYATCLNMNGKKELTIRSLAEADASVKPNFHGIVKAVRRLDGGLIESVKRDIEGLHILTETVNDARPIVFELEID